MILQVGMIEPDQLLGRLRALCTKLDAPALPNDLEEGQEILRYTWLAAELVVYQARWAYSVLWPGRGTGNIQGTPDYLQGWLCTKLDAPNILEEGQEILRYNWLAAELAVRCPVGKYLFVRPLKL
jgi:hypothetical protein